MNHYRYKTVRRIKRLRNRLRRVVRKIRWEKIVGFLFKCVLPAIAIFFLSYNVTRVIVNQYDRVQASKRHGVPGTRVYAEDIAFVDNRNNDLWEVNRSTLRKLKSEEYEKMVNQADPDAAKQEWINTLGLLANIEYYRRTGNTKPIRVCTQDMLDGDPDGFCSYSSRTIVLDSALMPLREYSIESVLHEVEHVYQNDAVALLDKKHLFNGNNKLFLNSEFYQYKTEFENYNDARNEEGVITLEDFEVYYNQACEIDAREFSQERTEAFLAYIESVDD